MDDWRPEQVISALQRHNVSIVEIAARAGISSNHLMSYGKWQRFECEIASVLNIPLSELWPSRYM